MNQEVIENGTEQEFDAAEEAAWSALESEVTDGSEAEGGDGGQEPAAQVEAEAGAEPPADDQRSEDQPTDKPSDERLASQYQAAMREERQRRQQVEQQLAISESRLTEINQAIQEAKAARQQQQNQPPTLDEDPVAFFDYRTKQLEAQQKQFEQTLTESQQQQQAAHEAQRFTHELSTREQEFAKATPDYYDAADHLYGTRIAELSEVYPSTPEGDYYAQQNGYQNAEQLRMAHVQQEIAHYANQALQLGRNPAEVFYGLAKSRGWTGSKPAPAPTPQQKIDVARAGARRSQSLSGGGAGGSSGNASIAELNDLYMTDPDAADALFDKLAAAGQLG